MSRVWRLVQELLGPGLHWLKSSEEIQRAIEEAERRNEPDVAEHLRIILKRRNVVNFDK